MPKVYAIQHIAIETLGLIEQSLNAQSIKIHYIRPYLGESIPQSMLGVDGLISMGGPMGVYEQNTYPYLKDELKIMDAALKQKKPVLGICLGSQLLAHALGAEIKAGPQKEIGWFNIHKKDIAQKDPLIKGLPNPFKALLWHGDIFTPPPGAVSLAHTELTQEQMFSFQNNAYGILFHLESTESILRNMVSEFQAELNEAGIEGESILNGIHQYMPTLHALAKTVFDQWASLIEGYERG
ncbi:MAG: GMP synthase (glutamine-hydrolyzing) [Candidatus Omnitrophota bacterium]|jgi:GMP synthase (glutamine-hydrolysing)